MNRTAPSQGPDANAEPDAFDRALAPQFPELLQVTRRELRHRLSLNQFAPDDLTPGQLLDMALQHARCERTRLPPDVDIKARALALIFRMAEVLTARNAGRRQKTSELLPEEAEPDPLYEEDEGEFFGNHTCWTIPGMRKLSAARLIARARTSREMTNWSACSIRASVTLLMHEVHGVSLQEIASAVGIPLTEAQRLLASARNRMRAQVKAVR